MKKIIEMKKNAFLTKIEKFVLKKKESPTKLYMPPATLSVIKIKFVFAKIHEVILQPPELSFFKDTLLITTKAKATDADTSKTYYFRFCEPLLKELIKARIYTGKNTKEKLETLDTYLNAVKDDKIIFEIISIADVNVTHADIQSGKRQEEKPAGLQEEEDISYLDSFPDSSVADLSVIESSVADLSARTTREEEDREAFRALFEESRVKIEEQGLIIRGLEDRAEAYKNLVEQGEAKRREDALKIRESELKIKESGQKIREGSRKIKKGKLKMKALKQTIEDLERENAQLKTAQAETLQAEALQVETLQVETLQAGAEEEEEEKDDAIDNLIADLDDEEIDKSLHLSEVIERWTHTLIMSRTEPVTVQFDNKDTDEQEEQRHLCQTRPRFLAIARLEREKAIHFATTGADLPEADKLWPKEEALATLKSDGYKHDLKCFSLYQEFPKELKLFAILFVFWELAHHNRFYRNALATVLNGGAIPDNLGITDGAGVDADQTDIMLKLLHYTDATRILMGHYDYIVRKRSEASLPQTSLFDVDLFITQDENEARFKGVEENAIDISRSTTETPLFM